MPVDGDLKMLEVDIKSMRFESADGESLMALQDLQFSCASNSFTSIVGPSGCGKTTTLRCILGLENTYDGMIKIAGGPIADDSGKVSAVFQEPRLLPWRTVEQNVRLALPKNYPQPELDSLFAELGLSAHRKFFPAELSLGLARRVSLARAFAVEPALLILDEPFVSLDDETAVRLRNLLMQVWSARTCTALMVTHNLLEAIALSDRILIYSGAPSRIVLDYKIKVPRAERNESSINQIRKDIESLRADMLS